MKNLILLVASIGLLSPAVFADQVTLKNGDRLTGDIIKSDDKVLVLKSEFAGEVSIQWAAVDGIVSTQQLHIGLKDGQTVVGTVAAQDGKVQLKTKEAGAILTAKDSIVVIRSDKEQAAYDAALDRLQHPHLTDFWGGFFDAGLSTTKGNSDTLSFVLAAKAVRDAPSDKISVYMNSIFAKNNTAGISTTTAHAITGGMRGDLNINPKLFAFGFTDFEFDQFQMLDLRNVLGGGAGYHAVKTKRTVFDLSAGGAYDQAFYSTGVNIRSGEIVAGEQLSYQISSRSSFSEQLQFFPNLSHTGQYRGNFDSSITTRLNSWLNWQFTFQDRYVSNPIPGIKNNDLLLSTGIRLTYGKGGN
jgi:putative salt-induced outer membrane protein YdiY